MVRENNLLLGVSACHRDHDHHNPVMIKRVISDDPNASQDLPAGAGIYRNKNGYAFSVSIFKRNENLLSHLMSIIAGWPHPKKRLIKEV